VYTLNDIARITGATLSGNHALSITQLLTDSRSLGEARHTLFVAISGTNHNGHHYIAALYQQGLRAFLVSEEGDYETRFPGAGFVHVPDTLQALQQLAAHHRRQFAIPVIGITGSNGKTMVKEWLYQLLKPDHNICRSPKSYNSQIGVPLSVWQLNAQHTLAIFEAGISQPGEMQALEEIIQPTVSVLTTIGTAHDEGFKDTTEKLNEKLKLAARSEALIVNLMSAASLQATMPSGPALLSISGESDAGLAIRQIEPHTAETKIVAAYQGRELALTIPFSDQASVQNACTCWALMLHLGYEQDLIQHRFRSLAPVALRLEIKQGINNSVLINDFYNSDMDSLSIALHYLHQQHRGGKKILVLSDIEQSGKTQETLYADVAALLAQHRIDLLFGIGKNISRFMKRAGADMYFFDDTADFIKKLPGYTTQLSNATILLKGSRSFGFEDISTLLQQKSHDTVQEINLNHLVHNINFYRSQLSKGVKLMCMVKATGYGSGSSEIAFTLQHHGVDYLAVAYADEGVELRKAGIHLPIMVMSPEENAFDDIIQYHLEPEIFSFRVLEGFQKALQNQAVAQPYPVHIKLDTGMHRLGFEEQQIPQLSALLKQESLIFVKSVFSHLSASDDASFDAFSREQISAFERMSAALQQDLPYPFARHLCNSGAITRFKEAHYDMVRLGIGLYGIGFNPLEKRSLLNVSTLKTRISQIREVHAGDTVGYSRSGKITGDTRIATVPIGYADGLSRKTGNGKFAFRIHGQLCPTVGNICMDMCMLDVTHVPCNEGDEAIVFESNEDLQRLSQAMETIPYEVLTGISTRVKRIYTQE